MAVIAIGKKRSADGGTPAHQAPPAVPDMTAETPLVLTLRDVEVPLPPTQATPTVDDGLVLSDAELQPEPYLGDPDADRDAQRAARRAQVRRDRLRDGTTNAGVAPAADAAATLAVPLPTPVAPAVPAVHSADALPVLPPMPTVDAASTVDPAPNARATTPASVAAATSPRSPVSATPTANLERPASDAPSAGQAAPAILVLRAAGNDPDPLCDQLRAFGFDVQLQQDPPDLPAPWPFVAVFVDQALRPAGGGDAMDLCNDVRERSRLPGVLKPVLVLVADQLSATNRVRAGLAGCNEILLGAVTRGGVARVLDTRGIALPSDARRA